MCWPALMRKRLPTAPGSDAATPVTHRVALLPRSSAVRAPAAARPNESAVVSVDTDCDGETEPIGRRCAFAEMGPRQNRTKHSSTRSYAPFNK